MMEQKGQIEWTIDPDANFDLAGQVQALPDFNIEDEEEDEDTSAVDVFLSKMNSPYKLMINNLPNNVPKTDLVTFVKNDLNITSAEIQYTPGHTYCYLQFPNLESCTEAMDVDGQSFQGKTLKLKISSSEQTSIARNANVRSKNSGQPNKNRFTQLKQERRGGQNRTRRIPESTKHNFPVGGTIRKNRKKNIKTNNKTQKSNAWGSSSGSQQPRSQNRRRGDPTHTDRDNRGNMRNNRNDNRNDNRNNNNNRFNRNDNRRDDQGGRRDNDQGGRRDNRMNSRNDFNRRDNRGGDNRGNDDNFNRRDNRGNDNRGNDDNRGGNRFARNDRFGGGDNDRRNDDRGNQDRGFGRRANNDRDPEDNMNWRNTDNHTIKSRRQNKAPIQKDQDGFSTSARAKPVKSVARLNQTSAKQKKADEKATKQKTVNRFDLFMMDEE